jgi:hypothetical protein
MDPWTVVLALYGLSIAIANALTYHEHRQRRSGSGPGAEPGSGGAGALLGHLLCTVWPLVALVLVVWHRPGAARGGLAEGLGRSD